MTGQEHRLIAFNNAMRIGSDIECCYKGCHRTDTIVVIGRNKDRSIYILPFCPAHAVWPRDEPDGSLTAKGNARIALKHKLEREGKTIEHFARSQGVTRFAIYQLFYDKVPLQSRRLQSAVASFMGYPTWHDFITSHSPTGGRS